ncbi:Nuclear hormone receptor family member nhr-48-like [Homarus americanus]|uniref:Nuclear hormone receptor family member nhr-48-like n=1 Tax=Homarus americanus TaxID=6706 RepID=A0A8J5KEN6_HOMAM|nr:Nuclear hormone receptor family member nhr-48-like [Homarus americanus]
MQLKTQLPGGVWCEDNPHLQEGYWRGNASFHPKLLAKLVSATRYCDPYSRGQESSEIGVASGGGSVVSGSTGGGTAKMSVVPRNPPAAVPTSGDTPSRKPVRLCQAFFRRSVQNDAYKHFRCGGDQKCAISIASRKFCKYCRFAKCESIGMTKSWVMSEDERLQLMKTRLTKRMMYQQGSTGSVGGNGSGRSESGGGGGRGSSSGSYSPNECSKESSTYPSNSSTKNLSSRYQNSSSSSLTYHSPTQPADLGSTGSSPNSSPSTPVSGPLTPIQYGPIPPPSVHQNSEGNQRQHILTKQESPVRNLCRGIKRESDEEIIPVDRVFNPASQYLDAGEVEILTRVISNIKLVDQQLPYCSKPMEVMATYKRFAERLTRFLRQFPEFNSLSQQTQGLAIKKNITVIALVFASSFVNEETGSYHNVHSPTQPMITNMSMIQKSQSPEVFNKFKEILGSLRQFNVDSRMAYLLVLIIVLGYEGQEANREIYQSILQHYVFWKYGEASGKALFDGLMLSLQGLRRHSELFESMAIRQKPLTANSVNHHIQQMNGNEEALAMDVKSKVEALTGEQIRQMLNGMDIEQMKQMLQGNGLEQMKQMLQSMESENSQHHLTQENNSLIHSPPLPCHSPQSMVQSPHSMVQSPHPMLPSPHNMLQSPQSMLSPQSMMESPHSMLQPSSSPGMLQSPNLSQSIHTMLDISHSMSHSPNSTVTQIINSTNNLLNHYQDMKPPGSFMNSPQSLDLSQSPIEISSPSPHAMNLAPSPAPYIPNQESYILDHQLPETPYPDHRQSPLDDGGYLNPPLYPQPPYSPAPLSDQYNSGFHALFSPLPYKEENQSISNSSTGSSGVGVSLTSSLTSPISSLLTSPAPSHSSLQESDNSLSNYHEPEHGNSLGAAP